ncbi:hypothetical protein PT287_07750 [Lactobacillus sp. ESL0679]|uniref:hypothetical protein n=1 Tax=Lactobacillus sp. ESL0679 TaxID=2983209 RepID=UPI0023F62409|nr:hypothetical protein [Lactobacillus sp. ESL0679]MDF7683394.1 hypothetical protein [Lactobacillus sp. ESL0679]
MSEEKRTIEQNGVKVYRSENKILNMGRESNRYALPMTKDEFESYALGNKVSEQLKCLIQFTGGVSTFWDKFGVPEKKWYVKVPHTYPSSWYQIGKCGDSTCIVASLSSRDDDSFHFTDSEIKKYHLEDCEKVPVDD